MSGEVLGFVRLSDIEVTSQLQSSDFVVAIKENTNSGNFECKKISLSDLSPSLDGGSSGGSFTFNRFTDVLPGLPSGQNRGTFTFGASAMLFKITSSIPARIRLYITYNDSENDLTRMEGSPVPENSGLLAEFVSTSELLEMRYTPALVIYNDDNPLNNFVYYTIDCSAPTDVHFTYVRLENVGGF